MKRMYKIILGCLSIVLILLIVVALFQLNQVNKTRQQVTAVRKEIRTIKKDIEKQEKEQKKAEILQKETKMNAEQKEEADTDAKAEESEESVETQEEAQKEAKEPEAGEEQKNQEPDANSQVPETGNGKKIAIDPGHQGYNVDMSAQEPMGPGSSEMKAKATTGTQGSFTGVPEYELNLNISKQHRLLCRRSSRKSKSLMGKFCGHKTPILMITSKRKKEDCCR